MTLADYCNLYDKLLPQGSVSKTGWGLKNIPYGLDLDSQGHVDTVVPFGDRESKKPTHIIPVPILSQKRAGAVVLPVAFHDGRDYLLDYGPKRRNGEKFKKACEYHLNLLDGVEGDVAERLRLFFSQPPQGDHVAELMGDDFKDGIDFILTVDWKPVTESPEIAAAYDASISSGGDGERRVSRKGKTMDWTAITTQALNGYTVEVMFVIFWSALIMTICPVLGVFGNCEHPGHCIAGTAAGAVGLAISTTAPFMIAVGHATTPWSIIIPIVWMALYASAFSVQILEMIRMN